MKTTSIFKTSVLAAAAALSACGGGGAGGGSSTPVKPPALVQIWTMQSHPYPAGSAEQVAFDELNRLRIRGGFGAITYDADVNQAAKNHLNYELLNNTGALHTETAGLPGYTGYGPGDRVHYVRNNNVNTNPDWTVREDGASGPTDLPSMAGLSLATGHLQTMLDYRQRRAGIASAVRPDPQFPSILANFNFAYEQLNPVTLPAAQGWSLVGVYPFPGMTNVGIGLNTLPYITAMNILVQFPTTNNTSCGTINPIVSRFTLRKNGDSVDVPTRQVVGGQYDYTEPTDPGWAIMFPTVILEPNTQYNVDFAGSFCGTVSTKTWSFTTGTSAYSQAGT